MSSPPTPPPLPPTPPPVPVQPLGYGRPPAYGRPGILTAVAVISIFVASVSLLVSSLVGLYGSAMIAASRFARTATITTTTAPSPAPAVTTPTPDEGTAPTDAADGMPGPERTVVVDALAGLRPLPEVRQKHLDALLAKAGKKVLPLSGDALTPRAVQANVTDAGHFPSGSGKPSAGADYFAVALGRIEVDDRHAVFYPLAGGDVIRASASEEDADAGTPPATPRSGAALADAEVREVVAVVEKRSGHKLNAVQARTLRQQLTDPSQSMFIPSVPIANQVKTTYWSNNKLSGTSVVTFTTMTGTMTLPSRGGVSTSSRSGAAFVTGGPVIPNVVRQAVLVVASSVLSLGLAVLLLVAGIMTLRDSRAARRLHLIYACVKLPIGIAALLAWGWMWYALMRGLPGGGASPSFAVSTIFALPIVLGLIYPVALLIVMHTRGVRAYYGPVTSP